MAGSLVGSVEWRKWITEVSTIYSCDRYYRETNDKNE